MLSITLPFCLRLVFNPSSPLSNHFSRISSRLPLRVSCLSPSSSRPSRRLYLLPLSRTPSLFSVTMSSRTQEEQQRARFAALEQRARDFQKEYQEMVESFATASLPLQRQAFECCVRCFDTCGIRGGTEQRGKWEKQEQQSNSAGSGWSRLFGGSSTGSQAATASTGNTPPAPASATSAACAAADLAEERKGRKVHEELSQCISNCHQKGEDVTRAVQQEIDVLQSKLSSCQKVCASRFQDDKNAAYGEGAGPLITAEAERCFEQCFTDAEPLMKEVSSRVLRRIKENTA